MKDNKFYAICAAKNNDEKDTYLLGMFNESYYLVPLYGDSILSLFKLSSIYDYDLSRYRTLELFFSSRKEKLLRRVTKITPLMRLYILQYMETGTDRITIEPAFPE